METSAVPEKKKHYDLKGRRPSFVVSDIFYIRLLKFHIETALNSSTVVEHHQHQLNDGTEMSSAECVEIRVRSLPDELGESTKPTRHPV